MKYVYICAPYRAKTKDEINENIKRVKHIAKKIFEKGYMPVYSHGLYSWLAETKENRKKIMQLCYNLIKICEIVCVVITIKNKKTYISEGMKKEIDYAKKKKKKIIYV